MLNFELFFKLLIGHAVADFALQNELMATTKNRNKVPSYLDESHLPMWPYTLTAHALINAGMVWVITQSVLAAFIEFCYHWVIDFIKCEDKINLHMDQAFHILLKIIFCYSII